MAQYPDDPTHTPRADAREIGPGELDAMIEDHDEPLIVDVRSAEEFHRQHIPGALHLALTELEAGSDAAARVLADARTRPVVLYSNDGARSASAGHLLARRGYARVYFLRGGMVRWQALGMAVVGDH